MTFGKVRDLRLTKGDGNYYDNSGWFCQPRGKGSSMTYKKETARPRGTDSAKIIEVIETKALRGRGTEADPVRYVLQYWSFEGKLLWENDLFSKEI